MKISEINSLFRDELKNIYPFDEIEALIFFTFNECLGFTRNEIKTNADQLIKKEDTDRIKNIVTQLKQHRPIQ